MLKEIILALKINLFLAVADLREAYMMTHQSFNLAYGLIFW